MGERRNDRQEADQGASSTRVDWLRAYGMMIVMAALVLYGWRLVWAADA